ncbi:hypothetical protein H5410_058557, partial [Solanum commersonii]
MNNKFISYYVIHSELRSAVIGKSSRWGFTADTISCFQCKPL